MAYWPENGAITTNERCGPDIMDHGAAELNRRSGGFVVHPRPPRPLSLALGARRCGPVRVLYSLQADGGESR
jgi:hypothetical protein